MLTTIIKRAQGNRKGFDLFKEAQRKIITKTNNVYCTKEALIPFIYQNYQLIILPLLKNDQLFLSL